MAVVAAALCLAGGAGSAGPAALQLRDCPQPPFSGFPDQSLFPPEFDVDCATLSVPENRSAKKTRTIKIGVAIVHAQSGHPRSDPIVFMNGGPSVGTIQDFAYYYFFLNGTPAFLQDRDLILVDTRGEGYSTPYLADPRLGCPELDQADFDTFYAKPFIGSDNQATIDDALRACRARLIGAGVDISAYNAAEEAADLDALRKALGVKQWNLWALSADGLVGLTYMRLYPGGIRSAVLDSPQNPAMNIAPDYYRGHAALFERVFAGCAANTACARTYPNLRDVFYRQMQKLQDHPQNITVQFSDGRSIVDHVDGVELWYLMRDSFFQQDIQGFMSRVWAAAHGRLAEVVAESFGPDAPNREDFNEDVFEARGRTESSVCHDLVNFVPDSAYRQAAQDLPYLAPALLDPGLDQGVSREGCSVWNNGTAAPALHQPVQSTIPR